MTTDNYGDPLADGVEKLLADRDAQIARWRKHASAWEGVARNTATALYGTCELLAKVEGMSETELTAYRETFRHQCQSEGVTP